MRYIAKVATGLMVALTICWPLLASAQDSSTRTLEVGGLTRSYRLYVPTRPVPGKLALVLMFHGGGGTAKWAENESGFSPLAEREGFLVAYPQG